MKLTKKVLTLALASTLLLPNFSGAAFAADTPATGATGTAVTPTADPTGTPANTNGTTGAPNTVNGTNVPVTTTSNTPNPLCEPIKNADGTVSPSTDPSCNKVVTTPKVTVPSYNGPLAMTATQVSTYKSSGKTVTCTLTCFQLTWKYGKERPLKVQKLVVNGTGGAQDGRVYNYATGTRTQIITGLTAGIKYTFTLSAPTIKSKGKKTTSVKKTVTPQGKPTKPDSLKVDVAGGVATLSWLYLGESITNMNVKVIINNEDAKATTYKVLPSKSIFRLQGISSLKSYQFLVYGSNLAGSGSIAQVSYSSMLPSIPKDFVAVYDEPSGSVNLTWKSGGTSVEKYSLSILSPGNAKDNTVVSLAGNKSSTSVSGLTAGATYTFTLSASNALGSVVSLPAKITLQGVPTAPNNLVVNPDDKSATLSWQLPSNFGSSDLFGYSVEISSDNGGHWKLAAEKLTTLSTVIKDLNNLQKYSFRVVAVNASGRSKPSSVVSVTPIETPYLPSQVIAKALGSSVTLTWVNPTLSTPIYKIQYKVLNTLATNDLSAWTTASENVTGTSHTISDLNPSTNYAFLITNLSAPAGTKTVTVEPNPTAETAPNQVLNLRATPGATSVDLTWDKPQLGNGGTVAGYKVEVQSNGVWSTLTGMNISEKFSALGLTPGTQYSFRISALNRGGIFGPTSLVVDSSPLPKPGAPLKMSLTRFANQFLTLYFEAPANVAKGAYTYRIEHSLDGISWIVDNANATISDVASTSKPTKVQMLDRNGNTYYWMTPIVTGSGFKYTINGDATFDKITTANGTAATTITATPVLKAGASSITVDSAVGIVAGMGISAAGLLSAGTKVNSVSGNTLVLSQLTTADMITNTAVTLTCAIVAPATTCLPDPFTTNAVVPSIALGQTTFIVNSANGLVPGTSIITNPSYLPAGGALVTAVTGNTVTIDTPLTASITVNTNFTIKATYATPVTSTVACTYNKSLDGTATSFSMDATVSLNCGTEGTVDLNGTKTYAYVDATGANQTLTITPGKVTVKTFSITASNNIGGAADAQKADGYPTYDMYKGCFEANVVLPCQINGLAVGYTYKVRVTTMNGNTAGESVTDLIKLVGEPSAPKNVKAKFTSNKVSITYTAPDSDGGSPIVAYILQYSKNGDVWYNFSRKVTSSAECIDGNAKFYVANGGYCYGFNPNGLISINNGDLYQTYDQFAASYGTSTFTNSSNYYQFRLKAVNDLALDKAITPNTPINSAAVAESDQSMAPQSLTGTLTGTTASLSWSKSAYDSSTVAYRVEYSSDNANWTVYSSAYSGTAITVINLEAGVDYTFKVYAVNNGSALSTPVALVLEAGSLLPGKVENLSSLPGDAQVKLSWNPPATGTTVSYIVKYKKSTDTLWTTSSAINVATTSYTIAGLENGALYNFIVYATNASGNGAQSSLEQRPYAKSSAVNSLTATADATKISLSWLAPTTSGGATSMQYRIQASKDQVTWVNPCVAIGNANYTSSAYSCLTANLTFTTANITKDINYYFRVTPVYTNATTGLPVYGTEATVTASLSSSAVTPVVDFTTTSNGTPDDVQIVWTPLNPTLFPVTGYIVLLQKGNEKPMVLQLPYVGYTNANYDLVGGAAYAPTSSVLGGGDLQVEVHNLLANSNYKIQVGYVTRAFDVNNNPVPGSDVIKLSDITNYSFTTPSVPGVVLNTNAVNSGATGVTVTWTTLLYSGGTVATGFELHISADLGSTWQYIPVAIQGTGNLYTVELSGFTSGATYQFRVLQMNAKGKGPTTSIPTVIIP